jgi:hypothetical protein
LLGREHPSEVAAEYRVAWAHRTPAGTRHVQHDSLAGLALAAAHNERRSRAAERSRARKIPPCDSPTRAPPPTTRPRSKCSTSSSGRRPTKAGTVISRINGWKPALNALALSTATESTSARP